MARMRRTQGPGGGAYFEPGDKLPSLYLLAVPAHFLEPPLSLHAQVRGYVSSIEDVQAATMQGECHDMIPPSDEHQLLLFQLLESMPSTEHERFLGSKLYSLVQVHTTRIY